MASYKERLTADLDRWIAGGLVAADQREAILADVPDVRRMDAATAMAWVGAVLLGVAVIAFVASNWGAMPRLLRFALILVLYGASATGAAWMVRRGRPGLANGLLTFAALVFAAGIGLTGQIFDLAGDPRMALLMAGAGAMALAAAAPASGPAMAGLLFIALADYTFGGKARGVFGTEHFDIPWLLFAAPAAAAGAVRLRSRALAHAAAVGVLLAGVWLVLRNDLSLALALGISAVMAMLAYAARARDDADRIFRRIYFPWLVIGVLIFFLLAGFDGDVSRVKIIHRLAWLALAGGAITLGRHDRSAVVTGAGVLALLGAIAAILSDLGLSLMAAAGVFFVSALVALGVGVILRRRAE